MPRFAANLTTMYAEHTFLDRFEAAAQDGFKAVEFLFPYAFDAKTLAVRLADQGLRQVLFNAPPGNLDAGQRGLACLPGQEQVFRDSFLSQALPYAQALDCRQIHVMAGKVPVDAALDRVHDVYLANLRWAAEHAQQVGVDILIEPINTRDMPGYFLNHQAQAHAIVDAVGASNLKVQMDLYHCQIMEGDLATNVTRYVPTGRVGHLQIAGVPDRAEPDSGEIHYPYLFDLLDTLGFEGHIGCEYRPRGDTRTGLAWLKPYLR